MNKLFTFLICLSSIFTQSVVTNPLLIFVYSIIAVLSAIYIEKVLGYLPCKLCIYQRIPFLIAIFVCFLGYNYFKSDRILIALIVTFTLSTALAGYHFGIENGIFDEYAGCTNTNIDITNDRESNSHPHHLWAPPCVRCDHYRFACV